MNYCIWDLISLGTTEPKKDVEYFGINGNVTSYELMCGKANVVDDNADPIRQTDLDKYPQAKNRMRTFHVQVVR